MYTNVAFFLFIAPLVIVRIGNPPTPSLSSLKVAQVCFVACPPPLLSPFAFHSSLRLSLLRYRPATGISSSSRSRAYTFIHIHIYWCLVPPWITSLNLPPVLSPALPLGSLLLVAATKLGIVVDIVIVVVGVNVVHQGRCRSGRRRGRRAAGRSDTVAAATADVDEVAGVLDGVDVLLDEVAELLVARVDELQGGEAALVLDARVGAGLEHHVDEVVAEGALGGGFGVEPADGGVQGGVALLAVDGVAFEVGLVEEVVDDVVFFLCVLVSVFVLLLIRMGRGKNYMRWGERGTRGGV